MNSVAHRLFRLSPKAKGLFHEFLAGGVFHVVPNAHPAIATDCRNYTKAGRCQGVEGRRCR